MTTEWVSTTWGDLATLEYGKGLRGYQSAIRKYRVFGTNGPIGWHSEPLCNHETVIVGRKGAYRGIHYSRDPCYVIDTAFYLEPKTQFDMRWAYYQLLTHDINGMDSGSAIPSTSRDEFYRLCVVVPPIQEQYAIAHVLGTLDDKIELNRRMNETLEAMARVVSKSWFVDFDPVRAKAEGRQPFGMDAETAALFPDSFEDSELGEIPKGWCATALGEVMKLAGTPVPATRLQRGEVYIGLEHMPRRSIALPEWGYSHEVTSNKTRFSAGDILFGKLRPYFHKVGIAPVDGVCSTDILVVNGKSSEWFGFVLGHVSSDELIQYTDLTSAGTKMPRTNWSDLTKYMVALPPSSVAGAYTTLINPLLAKISGSICETRVLASIRDTLLPKLLSGEIRVDEAKRDIKGDQQ